jgi:quercetin dioxygenase-like cupin family protein
MRRRAASFLALAAMVVVAVLAAGTMPPVAIAQESTPVGIEIAPGVSVVPLAYGEAEELPSAPATMTLLRLKFEPGATLDAAEGPEAALVYIESGTVTYWATAPTQAMRGVLLATPEANPFQAVPANIEITLSAGDSFFGPSGAGGGLRNDGLDVATVLFATVEPAGPLSATPSAG